MVNRNFLYEILKALKVDSQVLKFVHTIYCSTLFHIVDWTSITKDWTPERCSTRLSFIAYLVCILCSRFCYSHVLVIQVFRPSNSRSTVQGVSNADDLVMFCSDRQDEE